jgi:branched-chain amino acid transport system ATP-binding protein
MSGLVVSDIGVGFGGLVALDSVSFEVPEASVTGVIGPNGAGKTTLFNVISGFVQPTHGSLMWEGRPFTPKPERLVSHGISRTLQGVGLFGRLTALENVMVGAALDRRARFGSALLGLPGSDRDEARLRTRAREWLARLDAADVADRQAGTLAYPIQKRVALARALISRPRLLMLDEPAGGLGAEDLEPLADLIRMLPHDTQAPCSVVLVEHRMDLVMKVCDEVVVLDFGKCVAVGTPTQVQSDPAVVAAYLGEQVPDTSALTAKKGTQT